MNERYEQLMAQAWIEFAPDAKAVTKRFAGLIVRECLSIVEHSRIEGDEGVCLVGATKCKIQQHFGVE